jgi:ATP-dependent helicase/nuclease subunit B
MTILQQPPRRGDGPARMGWYECGPAQERYWDGEAWTDDTRSVEDQLGATAEVRAGDPLLGSGPAGAAPAVHAAMRVITGRPAALRVALAERVAELRRADPLSPITVLVGASLQRPFLARWLATRLGAHANVRVLMPGDLALLLCAPALVAQGRRALPPLADRVLLADVARKHSGYFAPVAETPGFGEALFRLVRELRGAGYDLGELGGLLDGATDAEEKAGSLAEVLADFEQRRSGFYGPDDALLAAEPARLGGLALLVWGMLDLPPTLERVLRGVSALMPVDLFVPDVPAGADAPLAELRCRLVADGVVERPVGELGGPDSALGRVRLSMFTAPVKPGVAPDGTLRLVSAPDPSREVRAAARACLGWAREGVPFWDMAVAYRHGESYLPLAEAVFVEAGIPVYLHEGSPLAERPIGRQTVALLALFDSDLSRQSVMDFLTDARLPAALHEEYGAISTSRWDSLSREAGIVKGAEQWQQRLEAVRARSEADDERVPDWRRQRAQDAYRLARFIAELDVRLGGRPATASWAEHLDYLQSLLARYIDGAEEVVVALRGLERFTALEAEVDFEWFLDVVTRAIGTLRSEDVVDSRPGAFAARGVNVVAVNSLVGVEFARVWIFGATERAFPPPVRQDPILLDEERERISRRAPSPLAPRSARGSEEALVFALACESARERLVVSYARTATGESRPRLPSVFFRELASQLEGERVSADDAPLLAREDVERIPGDAIGAPIRAGHARDPEAVSAAAAGAVSDPERDRTYLQARVTRPLAVATFERAQPSFARALTAARARFAERYSAWDGALGPDAQAAIAVLMPVDQPISPTSLEGYATCPQRFMLERLLRVKAVEEPELVVRIDALSRGAVIHKIFERFYEEWEGMEPAPLAPEAEPRMRAIAGEECDAARDRGETGYPAMWEADRVELMEDCVRWLVHERDDELTRTLPLVAVEARFGQRMTGEKQGSLSQAEPIEIELPSGALRLHGRIDRVNWDPQRAGFRIVDYKSGRRYAERSAELQGGRMLQLPLYVLAAAKLLGIDPSAGAAAYVYPTRKGEFHVVDWKPEDLAARHGDVLALLDAIVTSARRGDFIIAPSDGACDYCPFSGICAGARGDYTKPKASDERLARLATEIRSIP